MEQLTLLILLCFSMLFGSYISGTIPMVFSFSEEKLRLLTILGSGILVGTSLSVIIPEGVNALYSNHEFARHLGSTVTSGKDEDNPHSVIGLTLVIGFIFMLLIDQFANRHNTSTYNVALTSDSIENGDNSMVAMSHRSSKATATIGLVVHAAGTYFYYLILRKVADGIALGAAATTAHTDVEMIVFLAIMLHKAPAAFGLVTFLMHEGLDRIRLRRHLLAFSLSAPIGAFVTYFGISQSAKEALSEYNATGIAMLFSAGTFLYVATVHVLPEITHEQHLKLTELLALVGGAFIPSLLTVQHHH